MIALAKPTKSQTQAPEWHPRFLAMLPYIRRFARFKFRKLPVEVREESIQEAIANCAAAYARLVEQDREHLAFASVLARYAVAQVRVGRKIGNRLSIRDVMSDYAQYRKGFQVERLQHFNDAERCWQDVVVEDKRATPADIAACRIDFADWLKLLPRRQRKIALTLATGETTGATSKKHGLSPARISQLRQLLKENWERFQGEAAGQLAAA